MDKRKIEVNGEKKLYKENKEVSTLALKEAMLLFLVCLRSVERSVSAIFVTSVPLINLDFLAFPSLIFFKNLLIS